MLFPFFCYFFGNKNFFFKLNYLVTTKTCNIYSLLQVVVLVLIFSISQFAHFISSTFRIGYRHPFKQIYNKLSHISHFHFYILKLFRHCNLYDTSVICIICIWIFGRQGRASFTSESLWCVVYSFNL